MCLKIGGNAPRAASRNYSQCPARGVAAVILPRERSRGTTVDESGSNTFRLDTHESSGRVRYLRAIRWSVQIGCTKFPWKMPVAFPKPKNLGVLHGPQGSGYRPFL